jgi:Flp pilus assembly protein TadD
VRAWVNLGNVSSSSGDREEAERAYRKALTLAPVDRDALNNLAWLLLEEGTRLEEAEALASKAAEQPGPDQPAALDTLSRIRQAREKTLEP